ncbi:MAG: GcrA family cell cycle regulator [Caulobacteraceae bacterium]
MSEPVTTAAAWTPYRTAALARDFAEGLSCGESARRLGVSRAAVIGKRQRLGLKRRAGGEADPGLTGQALGGWMRWRGVPRAPADDPAPEIFAGGPDDPAAKTLAALEAGECRFPLEPTQTEASWATRFCARPALAGGPYCAGHRARAYRPPAARAPEDGR